MKKIIIANWKMNLSISEGLTLVKEIKEKMKTKRQTVILCPDFTTLAFLKPIISGSALFLGAQDSAAQKKGAYTGEVSAFSLKSLGVRYVLLGHSERRINLHENASLINQKIKTALEAKLIPVLCVGEKLAEKKAGLTKKYLQTELKRALKGIKINSAADLLVAYEPVWAISTSSRQAKPLNPEETSEIHAFLKKELKKILHHDIKVLYGGSVKSSNAASFLAQKEIAGLLVGGASLQASEFIAIAN